MLGDKDDETVLDSMAKVEKAMKASTPRPFRGRGRGVAIGLLLGAMLVGR